MILSTVRLFRCDGSFNHQGLCLTLVEYDKYTDEICVLSCIKTPGDSMKVLFQYLCIMLSFIAGIVAIRRFNRYNGTPLRSLIYVLWLAFVMRCITVFLEHLNYDYTWLYNIEMNLEILLFGYIFYRYQKNKYFRYFIIVAGLLFETVFILNYFVFSKSLVSSYQVLPLAIGSVFMSISIILFFFEMFKSKAVLSITDYLVFWVGIGLLLYYIIPIPLLFGNFIFDTDSSITSMHYTAMVQHIAGIFMYTLLIYGFVWKSKAYI